MDQVARLTSEPGRLVPGGGRDWITFLVLLAILALAAGLRGWRLAEHSFWYDEVVTMRLARAGTPAALLDLLFRIDATRAPLHPLLLQGWVCLFGPSEVAGRAFSAVCGVGTVGLVFWIGVLASDRSTGLWSAWLTAISPLLVYYSREARMYSWLVLMTCLAWGLLLFLKCRYSSLKALAYVLSLTALIYSHPLGLLMVGTLGIASLFFARAIFGRWRRWLGVQLGTLVLTAAWIPHYFDHAPEFLSGRLPIKFLLGTPIGFLGGNYLVLLGVGVLIVFGLVGRGLPWKVPGCWVAPVSLLLWLFVPPTVLYVYSRLGSPIFGPARYTVFVAPAYLILAAQGLARLPAVARFPLGFGITLIAALALQPMVYDSELKADWRGFAAALDEWMNSQGENNVIVLVASADPARNVEVETARYYLPAGCRVMAWEEVRRDGLKELSLDEVYLAVGARRGRPAVPIPESVGSFRLVPDKGYHGLAVYRFGR